MQERLREYIKITEEEKHEENKTTTLVALIFIGGLIILPQKANADEVEAVPVSISVKYGQTEARTILDMINEARTNSEHAW
ncbi:MAG: hypothetical protein ACLTEE_14400 [Anaerobutyricum hallii]